MDHAAPQLDKATESDTGLKAWDDPAGHLLVFTCQPTFRTVRPRPEQPLC